MQIRSPRRTRTRSRDDINGGFPEPPLGEPVHVVRCRHQTCGGETWVRIPGTLPESAIRRVICGHCSETFVPIDAGSAVSPAEPDRTGAEPFVAEPEATPAAPASAPPSRRRSRMWIARVFEGTALRAGNVLERLRPRMPRGYGVRARLTEVPRSRLWAWASVPLAAGGVVVGLALIQGSDSARIDAAGTPVESQPANAKLIQQPGFSLALPAGWSRSEPPQGAAFAATSDDGAADATLWIEQDPDMSFAAFEKRSLAQLSELAGNARVIDRVKGPTRETTITELQADAQAGNGLTAPYRVTLRGAGDYLYYFATSLQPGAAPKLAGDAELMHGSLRPEVQLAGLDTAK